MPCRVCSGAWAQFRRICCSHRVDFRRRRCTHGLAVLALRCEQNLFGPVDLEAKEVGSSRLRVEKLALVLADVEHGVVSPRIIDEGNVNVARQLLIDDLETLDQNFFLILVLSVL